MSLLRSHKESGLSGSVLAGDGPCGSTSIQPSFSGFEETGNLAGMLFVFYPIDQKSPAPSKIPLGPDEVRIGG